MLVAAAYLALEALPPGAAGSRIPWLNDLSSPDPFLVLPVFTGAALAFRWLVMRKFDSSNASRIKQQSMLGLAVSASVVSALLPAGAALFWATYATLMAGQHYLVTRRLAGTPRLI